ncbi:MAG: SH3 domain-containing protein [Chloroflexota bacterium]
MPGFIHAAARVAAAGTLAVLLCGSAPVGSAVARQAAMAVASADPVSLYEQPGWDAPALLALAPGDPVEIAGDPVTGSDGGEWLPVVAGGAYGFLPSWAVGAAWEEGAATGGVDAAQPATDDPPDQAPAGEPAAAPAQVGSASYALFASEAVNLRAAPSPGAEVLAVLPGATQVEISGDAVDGFLPVSAGGVAGWVAMEYLADVPPAAAPPAGGIAQETAVTAPEEPAAAPGERRGGRARAGRDGAAASGERLASTIAFPFRGGTWQVIQGYNGGTHTNRSEFARYKYAIDWERVDGETAGAPVYAPVSGTVAWTDPGSGGMMIDTGSGWGIVLFHVIYDGGMSAGAVVEQGQRIGRICGPSDLGYMNGAHVETDVWRLNADGSHDSVPFTGEFTIGGYDFPDVGGSNQHMSVQVEG